MFCQQKYDFNDVAPQTSDFIRYGNLPVAKNTGSLDLTIPIHTISTNSFTLPISVKYNSAGYIPTKRDGPVGSDWFLNVGGVIKREVRGIPDESIVTEKGSAVIGPVGGPLSGILSIDHGFLHTISSVSSIDFFNTVLLDAARSGGGLPENLAYGELRDRGESYEFLPDIFTFNVNGISGKFFMKTDGTVQVFTDSQHHIKVYMGGFRKYIGRDNLTGLELSTIELTDDRGYTYTFGGDISAIEFSYFYAHRNSFIPSQHKINPRSINAWHLKEIKAPNGDKAIFEYMNTFENVSDPMTNTDINEGMSPNRPHPFVINVQHNYSNNYETYSSFVNSRLGIKTKIDKTSFTMTKEVLLERIIIPEKEKIEFKYSPKKRSFFSNYSFHSSGSFTNGTTWKGYQLDDIEIINLNNNEEQEQLLNKFDFSYSYSSNLDDIEAIDGSNTAKSRKLYLREIEERGKGSYFFDYRSYKYIDPAVSLGVDHWGFYNGGYSKLKNNDDDIKLFAPEANFDDNGDFISYKGSSRNPSSVASLNNLLKKITYPTGGYSTFDYEGHQYRKRIEPLGGHNKFMYRLNSMSRNEICGGARIKMIRDYSSSADLVNSRTYKYVTNYSSNSSSSNPISSGILNSWPRYELNYQELYGNEISYIVIRSATSVNRNIVNGSHINYSKVIEIQKDGSYSICNYSDYITNPDDQSIVQNNYGNVENRFVHKEGKKLTSRPPNIFLLAMGINIPVSNSALRGKLLSEKQYNNEGRQLQEISNTYGTPSRSRSLSSPRLGSPLSLGYSIFIVNEQIKFPRNYLSYSRKTDYYDSGSNTTHTSYSYSDLYNKLLTTYVSNKHEDEYLEVENKYPFSEFSEKERQILPASITNEMLEDNILPVVGTYTSRTVTGNLARENIQKGALTKFKKIGNDYKYDEEFSLRGSSIDLGVFEKEVTYSKYAGDQPIEVIGRTGIPTTYIWGYQGEYPIAKIVGISVDELNSFLNESISYWNFSDTDLSKLDALRVNSDFKGLITTYTFKPGIGVTSVTDPRGRKTTYEYDPVNNRLKYVKDHEGNLVSKTEYFLRTKK